MDGKLAVAIVAGVFTAVGWLINHVLSERASRRRQHLQVQLDFTTQQIEELYGPLSFHIIEGKQVFQDLLESLGRNYVFMLGEQLSPEEFKTWMFWLEHSFLPRNEKIRHLLSAKTHLIDGSTMPNSYSMFLEHYSSWDIRHRRWKAEQIEYSWHSGINWPNEFSSDVLETFKILKDRHARLAGQL